jgi:preprotein translocase subunit SecY
VASIPSAVTSTTEFVREGELSIFVVLFILAVMVAIVAAVIFMERGHRRIPVQYAKRVVGRKVYGGQSSHLPLKLNTAGVIPPIFASSVLIFPATIASFADHPWAQAVSGALAPGSTVYNLSYVALIIFFCYFYTAVVFNPVDVADNMKKYGGFIPGIRPGQRTAEYIDRVLSRVTLSGALYVALICVLPNLLVHLTNVPFYFGGTALLIVVGVALDTVAQIETQILMRNYEGFMKRGRVRGRRG